MYDYIVLGSGPAGLQIGYFLQKSAEIKNYIILDKADNVCSFYKNFPRHRKMISINKRYTGFKDEEFNLRHDWNSLLCDNKDLLFKNFSEDYFPHPDDYIKYIKEFVKYYQLNIQLNTEIINIKKENDIFLLTDVKSNIYKCKYLIIATGNSKPYIPKNIKNIEYAVGYENMSLDLNDYIDKKVLILGKGNSAFETANHLLGVTAFTNLLSRNQVKMAWETHFAGDLRAGNHTYIDSYQLKSLNFISYNESGIEIKKENDQYYVTFNHVVKYDIVIRCTGWEFDNTIFDDGCKPELFNNSNNILPALKTDYESKNIKNMYYVGELTHPLDYRKSGLPFIHGFRYSIRSLYNILEYKNHTNIFKSESINLDYKDISNKIITRLKNTSALFTLFGYLCDVFVLNDKSCDYYQELPIEYIFNNEFFENKNLILVYFKFGWLKGENVLKKDRIARETFNGYTSKYLHPIIKFVTKTESNYKNYDRFTEQSHILCICGRYEKKEHMLKYTICQECTKVSFCTCGKVEFNEHFKNNIKCKICTINDDTNMPKDLPSNISPKSCFTAEHHIMEDLHNVDFHYNCYTEPLDRFLNSIFNNKIINLRSYYFKKIEFMKETFKNEQNEQKRLQNLKYLDKPVYPRFHDSQNWLFPDCINFPATLVKFTKSPFSNSNI